MQTDEREYVCAAWCVYEAAPSRLQPRAVCLLYGCQHLGAQKEESMTLLVSLNPPGTGLVRRVRGAAVREPSWARCCLLQVRTRRARSTASGSAWRATRCWVWSCATMMRCLEWRQAAATSWSAGLWLLPRCALHAASPCLCWVCEGTSTGRRASGGGASTSAVWSSKCMGRTASRAPQHA